MTKKKNSLTNIVNMVTLSDDVSTEVFVATADGEFGRFYIFKEALRAEGRKELGFDSLTLQDYLSRTQHYVGKLKADYSSRNLTDK
jgi:hypothetical protein